MTAVIPASMRAVRLQEFGEPAEVLSVQTLATPKPGPGQTLLRMTHRPINPSDTDVVRGAYGRLPDLPATPGLEGVGVVAALGATQPTDTLHTPFVGQRVIPLNANGTWAQWLVVDTATLLPVPDAVADTQAAQFVVNPVSAWAMLTDVLKLAPGDWLLQTAAGSTLGRLVLQIAPILGIRTINLVRRPEQAEELLAEGADAAFATTIPNLGHTIRTLTGGGVHGAIDAVGGQTGKIALSALRQSATLISYGWLSRRPLPLNVGAVLFRDLHIRGFWLTHWFQQHSQSHVSECTRVLMEHFESGRLRAPVGQTFDLEDIGEAVTLAQSQGRKGKVLLKG